jgi:hypothetical protein
MKRISFPSSSDYFVNLSPYINDSGVSVPLHFSLHRGYILFRTMGLRHMTVVSHTNQVEGILTRKDLMGFAIEEKLERLLRHPHRKLSRSVVLALRKNYGQKVKRRPSQPGGAFGGFGGLGGNDTGVTGEHDGNGNSDLEAGMQQGQQPTETTPCLGGGGSVTFADCEDDEGGNGATVDTAAAKEPNGNSSASTHNHNHV